jgi:enoyl-CoA hydratase/carnithine racemase
VGGCIRTETKGAIGWIYFDHPERRNAMSMQMWSQLPEAVERLARNDAVRVVIMRGAGEVAFISGADISEFEKRRMGEQTQEYDAEAGRAHAALLGLEKPLIAAIHGFCVGGGLALGLMADLRYAADDAVFAIPAARLGLGYRLNGVENLANVVGMPKAKEIFFTARRFTAAEALQMGLVNQIVAKTELDSFVISTAERIAENAPLTIRALKLTAREIERPAAQRDLAAVNAAIRTCFESEDYREGVRAFNEKRRPVFSGR